MIAGRLVEDDGGFDGGFGGLVEDGGGLVEDLVAA